DHGGTPTTAGALPGFIEQQPPQCYRLCPGGASCFSARKPPSSIPIRGRRGSRIQPPAQEPGDDRLAPAEASGQTATAFEKAYRDYCNPRSQPPIVGSASGRPGFDSDSRQR